jgi:hypothetical protein
METYDEIGEGGAELSGAADVSMGNRLYIRDLEIGDNVFFLQHTRVTAAVVQDVLIDSLDRFYVVKKAKTPNWLVGQSASLTVHESRVLPADEAESYDLIQETVY